MVLFSFLGLISITFVVHAKKTPDHGPSSLQMQIRDAKMHINSQSKEYAGEQCQTDSDCASSRQCWETTVDSLITCSSSSTLCACNYSNGDRRCITSANCLFGDRCMNTTLATYSFCLSCNFSELITERFPDSYSKVDLDVDTCKGLVPDESNSTNTNMTNVPDGTNGNMSNGSTSSNDTSSVCIAVSSLGDLDSSLMVYPTHRQSHVLCDKFENCATPGHMVEFKGRPMMMKTYCELLGQCHRQIKFVNSIRMKRGFRLPSKSSDMQFTAHAARYETRLEEMILRKVIVYGI